MLIWANFPRASFPGPSLPSVPAASLPSIWEAPGERLKVESGRGGGATSGPPSPCVCQMKTSSLSPDLCLGLPDHVKEPVFGLGGFSGDLVPPRRPRGGSEPPSPAEASRALGGAGEHGGPTPQDPPWLLGFSSERLLDAHLTSRPSPKCCPSASASEAKRRARNSPQQPSTGEAVSQRDQVTPHSRRVRTQIQHWSCRERLGRPAGSQDPVT